MPLAGLSTNDDNQQETGTHKRTQSDSQGDRFRKPVTREVVSIIGLVQVGSDLAQRMGKCRHLSSGGMVADEFMEKDLEIAGQVGGIKDRVPVSRVVDFRWVKEARAELSSRRN
jgi:hypothetical protein